MLSLLRTNFWKQFCSGGLIAALLVVQVYAGLPMITYEAPTFQDGDSVAGLTGWSVSNGLATVVNGEGFDSSQALKLHKGSTQDVQVTRAISMSASETVAFVDFRVKPAAVPVATAASTIVVNGSHLSFVRDAASGAGVLYALNGDDDTVAPAEWLDTSHRQALAGALSHEAQDWVRISIRQDYTLKEWDLYVDGVLYAAGMGFFQRGAVMDEIEFMGSQVADVFVDDLQADENNVLFTDADEDGIPDDYELANGMDITRNDRWDLNADGETFLDAYLSSIWPSYASGGNTQQGAVAPAASSSGTIPAITILGEHEVVGSVGGSFQVGGDGSAGYSVPLDLPSGTGGMVPTLSLNYSSSGGNGPMGVGWTLGGLQRITRGPATKARDGFIDPVDFDSNDRFYLDGERLVCISGTYGADEAEYRTENNSFARIKSHGQSGSGPAYWQVDTKAGLTLTFGNCGTSCVQDPSGEGALVWSINKVEDSVGNYYSICYEQDGETAGESKDYRPSKIRYTGNSSASLTPYNVVTFVYEDRPDVSSGYVAGSKVHSAKRLDRIDIAYDTSGSGTGEVLYQYELSYCDQDQTRYPNGWADFLKTSQTRRSLLHTITKKASDGTALPPTVIDWGPAYHANPPIKWASSTKKEQNYPVWAASGNPYDYSVFLDMNGDGLVDRVDHKNFDTGELGLWVSLSDGKKFGNKSKWLAMSKDEQNYPKWGNGTNIYSSFMDMNGDGLMDRVNHKNFATGEYGIWVALNTGIGFGAFTKWMESGKDKQNYLTWELDYDTLSTFMDMNGDGLPDRVDHKNYTTDDFGIWVRINTGSSFEAPVKWLDATEAARCAPVWAGADNTFNELMDINGDGLPDRVEHKNYSTGDYGIWVQLNKGKCDQGADAFGPLTEWQDISKTEQNYITWGGDQDVNSMFQDMNGDGLPDRVHHKNFDTNELALWVCLNTGKGFEPMVKWLSVPANTNQTSPRRGGSNNVHSMFLDINGDGLPDRVDHINSERNNDTGVWVRLNTGSGYTEQVKWLDSRSDAQSEPMWGLEGGSYLGMFVDMNGDGLPDRVIHHDKESDEYAIFVFLNTGNSFGASFHEQWASFSSADPSVLTQYSSGSIIGDFVDVNGDGLLDRVYNEDYSTGEKGLWVSLNNGEGFDEQESWLNSSTDGQNYVSWNNSSNNSVYSCFADMNGDGLLDRVDHKNYTTGDFGLWVSLSNGTSGYATAVKWLDMPKDEQNYPKWVSGGSTYSDLLDINGDGLPDKVDHKNFETNDTGLWVALNTGSGFGTREKWLDLSKDELNYPTWVNSKDVRSGFVDMNGDGMLDRVDHKDYDTGVEGIYVRLNTGTGFADADDWLIMPNSGQNYVVSANGGSATIKGTIYSMFIDLNNDGLPDRVDHNNYETNDDGIWVALNNGSGFDARSKWLDEVDITQNYPIYKYNEDVLSDFRDMNGDGLPDRVYHYDFVTDDYGVWVRYNTGSGFGPMFKWLDVIENEQNYITNVNSGSDDVYNDLIDINGDGLLDHVMYYNYETGEYGIWVEVNTGDGFQVFEDPAIQERVASITDGFGAEIVIEYQRLNDLSHVEGTSAPVYAKGDVSTLPAGQITVQDNRWVVSRYAEEDGLGGWRWKRHYYEDLRFDKDNEVPLGFRTITVTDEQRGQVSYTEYNQSFPTQGMIDHTESRLANGTVISESDNTYSQMLEVQGLETLSSKIYYPYQSGATEKKYDLDGTHLSTNTVSQSMDDYGSLVSSTITLTDHENSTSWTTTTTNVYQNDTTNWYLARLLNATVTKTGTGQASLSKTTAFTYDGTTGLLATETVEPGNAKAVTTTRSRDAFGNVVSTTTSASGMASRTSSSVYDLQGRFVIQTTNELGHSASMVYDSKKSLLLESTDANGLRTSFGYDVFGTKILTNHPHGAQTAEITKRYTGVEFPEIVFIRKSESSGSPPATVYLDAQGRERYTEGIAFDGRTIRTETDYDALGRKVSVSLPYFISDVPAGYQTIYYDEVDRVTSTVHPDGTMDSAVYSAFTTVLTNKNGQKRTRYQNAREELIKVKDNANVDSTFEYFVDGKAKKATGPGGHTVENTYDIFGNKLSTIDSDAGTATTVYDAFGQVTSSTDAKGQTTSFTYDVAGRPLSKISPEQTVSYTYDSAPGASLGKPATVSSSSGYAESFTYDGYGRTVATTRTINGETFLGQTWFDALGRVEVESDAGTLSVRHHYNAFGFESKITDAYTGDTYWEPIDYDASGRMVKETLGNGVSTTRTHNQLNGTLTRTQSGKTSTAELHDMEFQWDNVGNLSWRKDHVLGLTENFGYDTLNRVTSAHVTGQSANSFTYDSTGNITSKTGTGTYNYSDSSRPHRLSSITKSGSTIRTYAYDSNGAITDDGRRAYTWTSFNKVSTINQSVAPAVDAFSGASLWAAGSSHTLFEYDASNNRIRQTLTRGGLGINATTNKRITTYVGSYEREEHYNSSDVLWQIRHRHMVGGFLQIKRTETSGQSGMTEEISYFLKDHLGSVTAVLDDTGAVVERPSFDAWGKTRNATTWADADASSQWLSSAYTNRGYTGHEQLDEVGLIHMNGRVYDPETGRFLSPDPYIQDDENSQNFNRYAYVYNNPLSYTDPSGYFITAIFAAVFAAIKAISAAVVAKVAAIGKFIFDAAVAFKATTLGQFLFATTDKIGLAFAKGATWGGINGVVNGAKGSDLLRGMLIGGITGSIATGVLHPLGKMASGPVEKTLHAVGHGVVGGASNVAMGGKFQDGFLSGFAGAAVGHMGLYSKLEGAGVWGRTMVAGVVGGVVAEIGGGKFANGAYTAAFMHFFNNEAGRELSIAFYDGKDPKLEGYIGGDGWKQIAEGMNYDREVSISSSKELVAYVNKLREQNIKLDKWVILDHGNPGVQTLGNKAITLAAMKALNSVTSERNTVAFLGCSVAKGRLEGHAYMLYISKSFPKLKITAYTTNLQYSPSRKVITYARGAYRMTYQGARLVDSQRSTIEWSVK